MPKLSIFIHDFSATGVVRNAIAVAHHMERSGWNVTFIMCRASGELSAEASGFSQKILRKGERGTTSRGMDLLRSVRALRHELHSLNPDICLSAGNHAHFPLWLASRGLKRPLRVYRISNDLAHGRANGGVSLRHLVARTLLSDAQKVILVSPALGEDPVLKNALLCGQGVVIANGVDGALARRRAADPQFERPWPLEGDPIVLAAGRMVPQKNFLRLIKAAALANTRHPLRLIIIGRGSTAAREGLLRQAQECGFEDRLFLPGVIDNPFAAMKQASLVILPSLWEGSPNVLLEAMAVGAPVAASFSAGNATDILDHGNYGRLFDPLNIPEMADIIVRQLDSEQVIRPGNRVDCYDRHVSMQAYQQVFDQLYSEKF